MESLPTLQNGLELRIGCLMEKWVALFSPRPAPEWAIKVGWDGDGKQLFTVIARDHILHQPVALSSPTYMLSLSLLSEVLEAALAYEEEVKGLRLDALHAELKNKYPQHKSLTKLRNV